MFCIIMPGPPPPPPRDSCRIALSYRRASRQSSVPLQQAAQSAACSLASPRAFRTMAHVPQAVSPARKPRVAHSAIVSAAAPSGRSARAASTSSKLTLLRSRSRTYSVVRAPAIGERPLSPVQLSGAESSTVLNCALDFNFRVSEDLLKLQVVVGAYAYPTVPQALPRAP